jgi:hypothetical protein
VFTIRLLAAATAVAAICTAIAPGALAASGSPSVASTPSLRDDRGPATGAPPAPSVFQMENLKDDAPVTAAGSAARNGDLRDRRVGVEETLDTRPRGVILRPGNDGVYAPNLPSGCGVWSWTYRDGSYAKGSGLVSCHTRQPALHVSTVLERRRWYGWQTLDTDTSRRSSAYQVSSVSRWHCTGTGTYTYATSARATVLASNGRVYEGAVGTRNRFGC